MQASQTVGGLDPDQVRRVVHRATGEVDRCMAAGRRRVAFLGGAIALSFTVDANGRASHAAVTHSSLGDRSVERCMLQALANKQWPRPVGGEVGKIDQRFDFEDPEDRDLARWDAEALARAMAAEEDGQEAFDDFMDKLRGCQEEAGGGGLAVTAYLDEDGIVQSVGMAPAAGEAPAGGDCVDTLVKTTSFPSAGTFVKVTVELR
jgi:hypothetical protein